MKLYKGSFIFAGLLFSKFILADEMNADAIVIPDFSFDGELAQPYTFKVSSNGQYLLKSYLYDNDRVVSFITETDDQSEQIQLKTPFAGEILINNLSSDGTIAVGTSGNYSTGIALPTIWYGKNWSELSILSGSDAGAASAISRDKSTIGGYASIDGILSALIWSGENWKNRTILPGNTIGNAVLHSTLVSSFSADGKVAAGASSSSTPLNQYATIWEGDNWSVSHVIDGAGSIIQALSSDGLTAGGVLISADNGIHAPVIWYGDSWKSRILLDSVNPGKGNDLAIVNALSSDGSVAAGSSAYSEDYAHATLWYGNKWSQLTDLGSSVSGSYGSLVQSLSDDGTVASGVATMKDGNEHFILWKIKWPSKAETPPAVPTNTEPAVRQPAPAAPSENKPADTKTAPSEQQVLTVVPQVVAVDRNFTAAAVNTLAADSLAVIDLQQEALTRLHEGCYPASGTSCWSVRTGYSKGDGASDTATGFSFGTTVSPQFSAGFSFDKSVARTLPDSLKNSSNNIGLGFYLRWQQPSESAGWFIMPSLAVNHYKAQMYRPVLTNTESATGRTDMNGVSLSLTGGQEFKFNDQSSGGWFTGIRNDAVEMDGWNEQNAEFPLHWSGTTYRRTDLIAGIHSSVAVYDSLQWISSFEINHILSGGDVNVNASNTWLGDYHYHFEPQKTQWKIRSGISYGFEGGMKVALTPSVWKTINGSTAWGITAGLSSSF